MSWDAVSKVLDVERTLKARCEESTERRNKRREASQDDEVNLVSRI